MSIDLGVPQKFAFAYGDGSMVGDFIPVEFSQSCNLMDVTDSYADRRDFMSRGNNIEISLKSCGVVTICHDHIILRIRDKKVSDCTIEELLFAVRQKINKGE